MLSSSPVIFTSPGYISEVNRVGVEIVRNVPRHPPDGSFEIESVFEQGIIEAHKAFDRWGWPFRYRFQRFRCGTSQVDTEGAPAPERLKLIWKAISNLFGFLTVHVQKMKDGPRRIDHERSFGLR